MRSALRARLNPEADAHYSSAGPGIRRCFRAGCERSVSRDNDVDGRRFVQFELVDPAGADIEQQALKLCGFIVKRLGVAGKSLGGFREQFSADAHDKRECALAGHEKSFHR